MAPADAIDAANGARLIPLLGGKEHLQVAESKITLQAPARTAVIYQYVINKPAPDESK
jgi:hypothetical protein